MERYMGLDRLTGEEELIDERDLTIQDLVDIFGVEATRRGLEYMESLKEADEKFRESADPEALDEGVAEGFGVEDVDTDASDKWARKVEDEGLGLDDEQ